MTNDKGILIKNIYYMLTYAFKELRHNNYEHIAGEDFENIHDLFAEILYKGIAYLLKQGLHKEYVRVNESITTLRGKLDVSGTIKEKLSLSNKLACEYDRFSENNIFNQILKASVMLLIHYSDVNKGQKRQLRQLMLYFDGVDNIAVSSIKWNSLRYDRNSRSYQMLHSICFFLLNSKLLTTEDGKTKMAQFSDDHMNLLFQRFIMEYYRRHHKGYNAQSRQINWNLKSDDTISMSMLPAMQTDITLSLGNRTLIIDAKYYGKTLQENYGRLSMHSPNMYQIHTYVMNEDLGHTGKIDGMLLYARTESTIQPNAQYTNPDGNIFMARTLNLNADFNEIKKQLDELPNYI